MYSTHTHHSEGRTHLATRFARNTRVLRGDAPLTEDQMRAAAPSVFAEGKHASRSERYTYIPTIDVLRADVPLSEDQMRAAAPSVFAEGKHASRSERYTYIPTIEVLRGLRKEGFEPFMVAQGASRIEGKAEFTKHMVRMRH